MPIHFSFRLINISIPMVICSPPNRDTQQRTSGRFVNINGRHIHRSREVVILPLLLRRRVRHASPWILCRLSHRLYVDRRWPVNASERQEVSPHNTAVHCIRHRMSPPLPGESTVHPAMGKPNIAIRCYISQFTYNLQNSLFSVHCYTDLKYSPVCVVTEV